MKPFIDKYNWEEKSKHQKKKIEKNGDKQSNDCYQFLYAK